MCAKLVITFNWLNINRDCIKLSVNIEQLNKQKQSPDRRKGLCWSPRPEALLKKKLRHKCFPMNIAKISKQTFLTEHIWSNAFEKIEGEVIA